MSINGILTTQNYSCSCPDEPLSKVYYYFTEREWQLTLEALGKPTLLADGENPVNMLTLLSICVLFFAPLLEFLEREIPFIYVASNFYQ